MCEDLVSNISLKLKRLEKRSPKDYCYVCHNKFDSNTTEFSKTFSEISF